MSIEDIILDRDSRGVSKLRGHLSPNYCHEAAELILANPGTALIATGFYILASSLPETDGPPGALAIGKALESLGYSVKYVTDLHTAPLMRTLTGNEAQVIDFPIADHAESEKYAGDLLAELAPSVVISIERCGFTSQKQYLNMRGRDIGQYNAKLDYLFTNHPNTVGIGDGGNEIGMGNLAQFIPGVGTLPDDPCATQVSKLILASVSNWGGYGLVAAISRLKGWNLLPSVEEEQELVKRTVDNGAVDGILTAPVYSVDGFPLEENSAALTKLLELLRHEGVAFDRPSPFATLP